LIVVPGDQGVSVIDHILKVLYFARSITIVWAISTFFLKKPFIRSGSQDACSQMSSRALLIQDDQLLDGRESCVLIPNQKVSQSPDPVKQEIES
jgi:hypothetical protein